MPYTILQYFKCYLELCPYSIWLSSSHYATLICFIFSLFFILFFYPTMSLKKKKKDIERRGKNGKSKSSGGIINSWVSSPTAGESAPRCCAALYSLMPFFCPAFCLSSPLLSSPLFSSPLSSVGSGEPANGASLHQGKS